MEAIDWYNQRHEASQDESARELLAHNRGEEIEHACMAIEWLRRHMDGWDRTLRTYLFTDKRLTKVEETEEADTAGVGGR